MTEDGVIRSSFFSEQFNGTYQSIIDSTSGISHKDSLSTVLEGVNCLNWQVGHVVVARTNFLMLLDVPSIWSWDMIKRYVPGSPSVKDDDEALPFSQLLDALRRTQGILGQKMAKITAEELAVDRGGQTVAEHLAFYAAHEAGHASQIELISLILQKRLS